SAANIFNDDGLTERRPHMLGQRACTQIQGTACGEWHHDRNWFGGIGLGPRNARHGRESGSARAQMQEFAAGGVYFFPDCCARAAGGHAAAAPPRSGMKSPPPPPSPPLRGRGRRGGVFWPAA